MLKLSRKLKKQRKELREVNNMDNVIEVKPNEEGRYIVKLFGFTIELIPTKKPAKK